MEKSKKQHLCNCYICGSPIFIEKAKYNFKIKNGQIKFRCNKTELHHKTIFEKEYDIAIDKLTKYLQENNRFPTHKECQKDASIIGVQSYKSFLKNLREIKSMSYSDLLGEIDCFKLKIKNPKYYYEYLKRLKHYLETDQELKNNIIGGLKKYDDLPNYDFFISNCPDKNVKNTTDFLNYLGVNKETNKYTKEYVTFLIFELSNKLNRPLIMKDFNSKNGLPIYYINKYWGNINNMKTKLGLEVVRERMDKRILSINEINTIIDVIIKYCNINNVDNLTWNIIENDILKDDNIHRGKNAINKASKTFFGELFSQKLLEYNIHITSPGRGYNYTFDDGEKSLSEYEYRFSKCLKEKGYKYNVDYKKDVKYKYFSNNINKNYTCDYVINYNDKKIYIEIAGILRDYKRHYVNNIKFNSKSKMEYYNKLKIKENILIENKCDYLIIFPEDIDYVINNLEYVFDNSSKIHIIEYNK